MPRSSVQIGLDDTFEETAGPSDGGVVLAKEDKEQPSAEVESGGQLDDQGKKLSRLEVRAKELHELRKNLAEQEHAFKIQIMQLDLNMKEEEHELKMEILRAIRENVGTVDLTRL